MKKDHVFTLVIELDDDVFFDNIVPYLFRSIRKNDVIMRIENWQLEELTFVLHGKTSNVKRTIKDAFGEDEGQIIIDTLIVR
jgi:hypothetical protein